MFFDRDGVLTELVAQDGGERESPLRLEDLRLRAGAVSALQRLTSSGFDLFVVSNQPSYAKGKCSLDTIDEIAAEVERQFDASSVRFTATYYCLHHPDGVVPGYSGPCECRKPSPHFLLQASGRFGIDLRRSWLVGDRDSDIECGRRAGCRTVLIRDGQDSSPRAELADRVASDVGEAAAQILAASDGR